MASIGKISLDLNVNKKGFEKQVNSIKSSTTKAFNVMSVAAGNIIADLATRAIKSIGNFVKDSINKGSELTELENVVESVFVNMADKVDSFAKNALDTYGLTEKQAKKMVGTFGAMSKSFGYSEKQAYDMSTALAALTGDVASFYNLSVDEAYTKMKSVFTGETESLKELGVVMTQAALDEFALAKGFGKTTSKMSEQEKVALRLAFVQDKLSSATGDVVRTQDSWANQTRKLSGQIDSFKTAIGQGLINILTPVIKVINAIMSKLVQLAQMFASFTGLITGKGGGGKSPGKAMASVAAAAESAATSTEGIESAAAGAAGAAKEAQKSLMGFDEINKLQDTSDSGGGGGGGSTEPIDFGLDVAEQEGLAEGAIKKLDSVVDKLVKSLKDGFKVGLGDDFEKSLKRTKEHVGSIKEELISLFTSPEIVAASYGLALSIANTVGKIAGTIASIGATIAENLLGGFDLFLQNNSGFIKERITSILSSFTKGISQIGNVWVALGDIFSVFRGDVAKSVVSNFMGIIANTMLGYYDIISKVAVDLYEMITQPFIDNKDAIKTAIENILSPVDKVLSTLNESIKATFTKVSEVYTSKIQPVIESFKQGLSDIISTLLMAFNNYIAPILDALGDKFGEVWKRSVQPAINKMIDFIGKLANAVKEVWDKVLVPLINWIISTIIPVIAPIIGDLLSMIMSVLAKITEIVGGIIQTLGGLIDFIVGIFTGDWELAWEGIKSIFEGVWTAIEGFLSAIWESIEGIVRTALDIITGAISTAFETIQGVVQVAWEIIKGVFSTVLEGIVSVVTTSFTTIKNVITTIVEGIKTVITSVFNAIWSVISGVINTILSGIEALANGVVSGMNLVIDALNNLSFEVPDWVPEFGGKRFGFNLSKLDSISLPRLAQGGYVKANQPQPVIIGDNKTQGEIVSPENKMFEVMFSALEHFFGKLMDSGYQGQVETAGDIVIPIYLDGTMLEEVIVTAQQRRNIRSGGR